MLLLFLYTYLVLQNHFCFCFTLEVEGVLFLFIINVIQSCSFQLYEIIIDCLFNAAKVASKQCSVRYYQVIHLVERTTSLIFFESFYFTNERFDKCQAQEKSPALKNSWLRAYSRFLSNVFKSLIISFVYLTNHLTNIRTKLYTLCTSHVQSHHNNIKKTLHKGLF